MDSSRLQQLQPIKLKTSQLVSLIYHDLFDYPLTQEELDLWKPGKDLRFTNKDLRIKTKENFYFVDGRQKIVGLREERKKIFNEKMLIAKRAAQVLAKIPSIQMIGVTGSLAMGNASKESDVDFLIITNRNSLWISRALAFLILKINSIKVRRANVDDESDKICMNMWMDELDLRFEVENIFNAHEIIQIIPIADKKACHLKLLEENRWARNFWPKAYDFGLGREPLLRTRRNFWRHLVSFWYFTVCLNAIFRFLEPVAYLIQKLYMRGKVTREVITPTRAFFHPKDWSGEVIKKLEDKGVY
jgi:predicted nucleotidyltransferase